MNNLALSPRLVIVLPLLAIVLSFVTVYHQYTRRDNLKSDLSTTERQYTVLMKQYQTLHAKLLAVPPAAPH